MVGKVGDRIEFGSAIEPCGAVVVIAWDDGRTTRIPANVLERLARKG